MARENETTMKIGADLRTGRGYYAISLTPMPRRSSAAIKTKNNGKKFRFLLSTALPTRPRNLPPPR